MATACGHFGSGERTPHQRTRAPADRYPNPMAHDPKTGRLILTVGRITTPKGAWPNGVDSHVKPRVEGPGQGSEIDRTRGRVGPGGGRCRVFFLLLARCPRVRNDNGYSGPLFEAEGRRCPRTRDNGPASEPLYKEAKAPRTARDAARHEASCWGAELGPNEVNMDAEVETDGEAGHR